MPGSNDTNTVTVVLWPGASVMVFRPLPNRRLYVAVPGCWAFAAAAPLIVTRAMIVRVFM